MPEPGVAVCGEGARELRRQPEPVARVVMEFSGHYWLNLTSHLCRQGYPVAVVNRRVAALLDSEVAQRLLTIPGVGSSTAGALMAEIGDIWRFADVDQLLASAGVHP